MSLLLLFSNDTWTALAGQSSDVKCGTIRADWHIDSATGQPLVQSDVPLVGSVSISATGTITASSAFSQALVGIESATGFGLLLPVSNVPGEGSAATSAAGDLDNETTSALLGAFSLAESGTVSPLSQDISLELTGEAISGQTGSVTASGGEAVSDDLLELQRQRRFGKQYRTLVRTPYRRTIR